MCNATHNKSFGLGLTAINEQINIRLTRAKYNIEMKHTNKKSGIL